MTADEKIRAKERAIEVRRWGGDIEDCALQAGIDQKTLYNWRQEDSQFSQMLEAAWSDYKLSLIKLTKQSKSDYLLQNDFPKRFKKANEIPNGVTNNILIVGDDQLSKLLYGFTKKLTESPAPVIEEQKT